MSLPACEAVMFAVPVPTIVTVLPETVATAALSLAKATARPDDALAVSANAGSLKLFAGSGSKEIVCASFAAYWTLASAWVGVGSTLLRLSVAML